MTIPRIMRLCQFGLTAFFSFVVVEIWRNDPQPWGSDGMAIKIVLTGVMLLGMEKIWPDSQHASDSDENA